jgi:hypothetical protein
MKHVGVLLNESAFIVNHRRRPCCLIGRDGGSATPSDRPVLRSDVETDVVPTLTPLWRACFYRPK